MPVRKKLGALRRLWGMSVWRIRANPYWLMFLSAFRSGQPRHLYGRRQRRSVGRGGFRRQTRGATLPNALASTINHERSPVLLTAGTRHRRILETVLRRPPGGASSLGGSVPAEFGIASCGRGVFIVIALRLLV